ncbi:MAG: HEAT repeat domain-containing protein [Chloroflexota bacterium]
MDFDRERKPARPAAPFGEMMETLLADLVGGDETRAETASAALSAMGETIIPFVRDLLRSPDADSRWWAVRTLASLPNLDPGLLLPSLADPAPEVRQAAALGLASHPRDDLARPLVQALSDEDGLTAELAANALVAIGPSAVESLLEVLGAANQSARIHAMRALAEIADPRAIRPMIEAMSEDSAMLHYWAERGLDRLGVSMVYVKP